MPTLLSNFLNILKQHDELMIIDDLVSCDLEISKMSRDNLRNENRAILFEEVEACDFPVVTNLFGSKKRLELAFRNVAVKDVGEQFFQSSGVTQLKMSTVNSDFFQYHSSIDLTRLPALKSYRDEGGRFFTFACVVTKNPVNGTQNMGIYRMQLFDDITAGMHWHTFSAQQSHVDMARSMGMKSLDAVVILGCDPLMMMGAALPFKPDEDEMGLYCAVTSESIQYVQCQTVDLKVPAQCDVIIEGVVPIDELRPEGPFLMHTGKYDAVSMQPVFHATAIASSQGAVVPATVPGIPPAENAVMVSYGMKLFLPEVRKDIPGVIDFHLPIEGVFNRILYVKTVQDACSEYLFGTVWQHRLFHRFQMVVLFDDTADLFNQTYILWQMGNIVDWQKQTVLSDGKIGIDCRRGGK